MSIEYKQKQTKPTFFFMSYVMTVNDELIRRRIEFHPNAEEYGLECAGRSSNMKTTKRNENKSKTSSLADQMTQIDLCQDVKSHEKQQTYFFSLLRNRLKSNVRISLPVLVITAGQLIHRTMATRWSIDSKNKHVSL